MSDKIDHLNIIESAITRMAGNSLQIKCWSLAIVSAAIVLSRSVIIVAWRPRSDDGVGLAFVC